MTNLIFLALKNTNTLHLAFSFFSFVYLFQGVLRFDLDRGLLQEELFTLPILKTGPMFRDYYEKATHYSSPYLYYLK